MSTQPKPTAQTIKQALQNVFLGIFTLFGLVLALAAVGPTNDHETVRYEFGPAMARPMGGKP